MNKREFRREQIYEKIEENNFCSVKSLMELTKSSESTIKRDLDILEKNGKIQRLRGGAIPVQTDKELPQFDSRIDINKDAKEVIAYKAASMIEDYDTIFIDSGSTLSRMLKYIKAKHITIFTNSISIVIDYINNNYDFDLNIIAGKVSSGHMTVSGIQTAYEIDELHFDKVFLSTAYMNIEYGIVDDSFNNKAYKSKLTKRGKTIILCADSSKLKAWEKMKCIPYKEIDYWITDIYLQKDLCKKIEDFGVVIYREG